MKGVVTQAGGRGRWGVIIGEDGGRYTFTLDEVRGETPAVGGSAVEFTPADRRATGVLVTGLATDLDYDLDLGMWAYFVRCMKKSFSGDGRARRKEYWSFALFTWLIVFGAFCVLMAVFMLLGASAYAQTAEADEASAVGGIIALLIWLLALPFLPASFAVSARRLHDVGLSGWLALLLLVPYAGGLFMFVVALIPSQAGTNRYGRHPKPPL